MENKKLLEEKFLTYKKRKNKNIKLLIALSVLLIITSVIALSIGASGVKINVFVEYLQSFFTGDINQVDKIVLIDIRLARIFVAVFVGIALASSGLLMQGIFQNPLVSPYTLGVSNGAAFGAAVSIIYFTYLDWLGAYKTPIFAFVFSIITMLIVYIISCVTKNSSKSLILSGVAIGYLFSAMVSFLKYVSDSDELPEIVFWMMGGMSGVSWENITLIIIVTIICVVIMIFNSWSLNIMELGEENATSMGINYKRKRNLFIVLSTLMTAIAVAFTGIIGFVGIIAPHISRMLFGSDYRYLICGNALIGSLLLLVSDTLARNIIAPTELPVGIVTSFIGVPFFIYLIIKGRGK